MNLRSSRGFTFIEIMITLTLFAVLMVPLMQVFTHSIVVTESSLTKITATNLARTYMERTINLNMTKKQLAELGDEWIPPAQEPPMVMNGRSWRISRHMVEKTDPLEIQISVFDSNEMEKPIVTLVTLLEDMAWEPTRMVQTK